MKSNVKNAKFDDIQVSHDAHGHIWKDIDSKSWSYNPVDSPVTSIDIAGTNTGVNNDPTEVKNVTVSCGQ